MYDSEYITAWTICFFTLFHYLVLIKYTVIGFNSFTEIKSLCIIWSECPILTLESWEISEIVKRQHIQGCDKIGSWVKKAPHWNQRKHLYCVGVGYALKGLAVCF